MSLFIGKAIGPEGQVGMGLGFVKDGRLIPDATIVMIGTTAVARTLNDMFELGRELFGDAPMIRAMIADLDRRKSAGETAGQSSAPNPLPDVPPNGPARDTLP